MNALPPRSQARDAKRQAILEIARDAFVTEGFAATSMSSIAAKLGGSKGTLYNYFRSKEELFEAIMIEACGGEVVALTAIAEGGEVEAVLHRLGERFVRFVTSEDSLAMYRLVAAECQRFPELGRLFWDNGPRLTVRVVGEWMARQMEAGALRRDDPERAAAHLLGMFKAQLHQACIWKVRPPLSEAEIVEQVDSAVRAFLHGYGAAKDVA